MTESDSRETGNGASFLARQELCGCTSAPGPLAALSDADSRRYHGTACRRMAICAARPNTAREILVLSRSHTILPLKRAAPYERSRLHESKLTHWSGYRAGIGESSAGSRSRAESGRLSVYEDWSGTRIRGDRWRGGEVSNGQEVLRQLVSAAFGHYLTMSLRREGETDSNTGSRTSSTFLNIANPASDRSDRSAHGRHGRAGREMPGKRHPIRGAPLDRDDRVQ